VNAALAAAALATAAPPAVTTAAAIASIKRIATVGRDSGWAHYPRLLGASLPLLLHVIESSEAIGRRRPRIACDTGDRICGEGEIHDLERLVERGHLAPRVGLQLPPVRLLRAHRNHAQPWLLVPSR
jgi:hypothetical protein